MATQANPGWYDVGDGMAGRWDGERWTGERISHQRLAAMTAPPPPTPPPAPTYPPIRPARRQIHPVGWVVLIVLFIFVGLPLIAAFMQGFSSGLSR